MEMEHKQSIRSLAGVSRNVEVALHNTQSEVHAIAAPVHRVNMNLDRLLHQGEDTNTRVSEMQFQVRQYHDDLCRTISDQHRLLIQQYRGSSPSLEHNLLITLGELGAERELFQNRIKLLDQQRKGEAQELAARVDVLVRTVQY